MERLTRRADFLAAAAGAKAPVQAFVLQARDRRDAKPARVGFTVTRKVGNAVVRNRVRRRLREAVRLSAGRGMRTGFDYVLIGRQPALSVTFDRMVQDLDGALRRVHLRRKGETGSTGNSRTAGE
jgi:ribonuclease P protein component